MESAIYLVLNTLQPLLDVLPLLAIRALHPHCGLVQGLGHVGMKTVNGRLTVVVVVMTVMHVRVESTGLTRNTSIRPCWFWPRTGVRFHVSTGKQETNEEHQRADRNDSDGTAFVL